jgi:nicotinic acid mononucleotide adenylyltransferase
MAKMAFGNLPGAVVADEQIEKAFAKGDMPKVFKTLRAASPEANLYLIMGDDSYERLAKIPKAADQLKQSNIKLVVANRDGLPVPEKFGELEITKMPNKLKHATSSTEMRKDLCQGIRPDAYMVAEVIEYALKEKLYAGACKPAGAATLETPAAAH